ncbi:hypothetical protein A3C96_00050 [Candidatus Uhrbacteria bacterium RIFCSPHIGHO2_02_FULL_60_10]|uniref:Uncharacterized protein n=1 Tax=Candidatus Uhrbacteria bacterium RIFCSPHIGHO2_02_FULL_60_10 TaxID=1802392 RepID=A0A1F7U9R2_9BACT|nr:MAG: hypothetical protein A3C96_00050 [Candidatus Uhrbacteria bacterium RIFCSPHIGHO2_02_FULL_60_10]
MFDFSGQNGFPSFGGRGGEPPADSHQQPPDSFFEAMGDNDFPDILDTFDITRRRDDRRIDRSVRVGLHFFGQLGKAGEK